MVIIKFTSNCSTNSKETKCDGKLNVDLVSGDSRNCQLYNQIMTDYNSFGGLLIIIKKTIIDNNTS